MKLEDIIKLLIITILFLILTASSGCLLNPHDLEDFDNYYFEPIDLTDNLVFYHFNEASYTGASGDVIDSSGFGKNSTTSGGPIKEQGIYGEGISCSGASGFDLEPADFDTAFSGRTISVWFRARSTNGIQYIFEEGGEANGINIYIQDGILYGGTYRGAGANFNIFLSHTVEVGKWYHIVTLFDSMTDRFYMYVDGIVIDSDSLNGFTFPAHSDPNGVCFQNNQSFRHDVGAVTVPGFSNFFDGIIDELAVWNRALSNNEILNLWHRQGRL